MEKTETKIKVDVLRGFESKTATKQVMECQRKIINAFKIVDGMADFELAYITKRKADKRHTRRSKTLKERLDDISDYFGYKVFHASMASIYVKLTEK